MKKWVKCEWGWYLETSDAKGNRTEAPREFVLSSGDAHAAVVFPPNALAETVLVSRRFATEESAQRSARGLLRGWNRQERRMI